MFNLTKQEILVLSFIGLAAVVGIGVDFYSKKVQPLEAPVYLQVNINKADKEELIKLNGIGPVLAQRIIKYRASFGPFKDIEGLKKVYGIDETKFQKFKKYLRVN
ncbi:MAG: helix-hairpin-helix domain-containing protein [Candidatus Omnitrophica bacterium]|nr:helix-hairpin-helix domain-containing protein [Candidatus Omnitrophota bacterium]